MDGRILERERHQIEHILELDLEELQVEEVDDHYDSSDDGMGQGHVVADANAEFTFDPELAPLHSYLGEVEDTHHRMAFLDGCAILTLPLFYLQGIVLFPEANLPLRIIQPNFIAAVEKALTQVNAPYTMGVVRIYRDSVDGRIKFANVGTTAEIRQYRRLEDGSINVVTRGKQRFRLKRCWFDAEGMPCGDIQIIQEDFPLRTPRDAFGKLPLGNGNRISQALASSVSCSKLPVLREEENDYEANSEESFESELSLKERKIHQAVIDSCNDYEISNESASGDDDMFLSESEYQSTKSHMNDSDSSGSMHSDNDKEIEKSGLDIGKWPRQCGKGNDKKRCQKTTGFNQMRRVPRAFWPYWVYSMYDSYCLAQRASDMWKQIVGAPSMDGFVKNPDLLSFYIASKIPVSESARQELLEIDGISYRLCREIELLKSINLIQCKTCQKVIARRSDMLVMSSDGPLGAYVNPHGYVHEVMTFYKANGLSLRGRAQTEYSWFPGYAWTIAVCATCDTQLGWRFTAVNKNLKPRSFSGIRSSQVADGTC